jgi:hypothetical protein
MKLQMWGGGGWYSSTLWLGARRRREGVQGHASVSLVDPIAHFTGRKNFAPSRNFFYM